VNRPLEPWQVARRDQVLAEARAKAAEPGRVAIIADDAPEGVACSMCDCDGDPASHDEASCRGCPDAAWTILIVFYSGPQQTSAPVCARHLPEAWQILLGALEREYPDLNVVAHPESDWRDPE
jgi:hypothetical protein